MTDFAEPTSATTTTSATFIASSKPHRGQIAFAQLLETLLNNAKRLDGFQACDLFALAPAVIQIEIQPAPYKVCILINESSLTVQSQLNGEADCQIKAGISDWASLNSLIDENSHTTQVDYKRFQIQGNQEIAESFLNALNLMELDWEEKLSHYTGDLIAHQIGHRIRQWHRYKKSTGRQITEMFEEYLKHELRVGPSQLEMQTWQTKLEELEKQTQELLNRAKNLK